MEEEKTIIEQAKEAAEEIKRALAEMKDLKAQKIINGISDNIPTQVEEKKPLTPKEYKDAIMRGEIPLED